MTDKPEVGGLPGSVRKTRAWAVLSLPKSVSALEMRSGEDGRERAGIIAQLPMGAQIEIIGPGFSDQTLRVQCLGQPYFVFTKDVTAMFDIGALDPKFLEKEFESVILSAKNGAAQITQDPDIIEEAATGVGSIYLTQHEKQNSRLEPLDWAFIAGKRHAMDAIQRRALVNLSGLASTAAPSTPEGSSDQSIGEIGHADDIDPTLWTLTKTKFVGYLRWTALAMLLGPLAFWIVSRK
jgi:hypothetical protein